MSVAATSANFRLGAVIANAARMFGRHFLPVMLFALVLRGGQIVGEFYVGTGEETFATNPGLIVAISIANSISLAVLWSVTGRLIYDDLSGRKPSILLAVGGAIRRFLLVVIAAVLTAIGILIGSLLLIVPGLILSTHWAFVPLVIAAERIGPFSAMRRSTEVSEDHRWLVFGFLVLFGVADFGVSQLVYYGYDALSVGSEFDVYYFVAVAAVLAASSAVNIAVMTALYHGLRAAKEGAGGDEVAAVFE